MKDISDIDAAVSGLPPDEAAEMPLPTDLKTFFLGCLTLLAILAAAYAAGSIIMPIVLAFVLKPLLQPAVDLMARIRVPRVIGALLVIVVVMAAIVGLATALSGPATAWTAKVPDGLSRLEAHVEVMKRPISALLNFIGQAERAADGVGQRDTIAVRHNLGLSSALLTGARAMADGFFTTMLVLYFLLVSGDMFLRRIVEILPSFGDKRQAVDISNQIETDVSAYLLTISAMNAAVGVATGLAMHFCGLGDPLLWGTVAFALNFVPILGPLLGIVVFTLAGMLSFDNFWNTLLPPILYFAIHVIEGETLTPLLLARRFTLNPVVLVISFIFWFWMWGAPGVILSVPMLAIFKIVCDRVRSLKALGHFLEG